VLVAINLAMLPFYILALFVAGLGIVLFYAINGWLTARMYYEQVALRRRSPADVKAWRRANAGILWLTGIVIVFLGTIPVLNLLVPVVGTAAMVHVAQTLKAPAAPGRPFNPPA
jgi:CysZ protein